MTRVIPVVGDTQVWFARHALLPGGLAPDVTFEVAGGRYTAVTPRSRPPAGARLLSGVVMPGLANAHSQVAHRALRGRGHAGARTPWQWREQQNALIAKLDPDNLRDLARATFAEMSLAGVTSVGEFHLVHHNPDGRPYADPNAMGTALVDGAADAGVRLTLFDALYLSGGLGPGGHYPPGAVQVRFGDASADAWAARVAAVPETDQMRVGVGIPTVQRLPRLWLPRVREVVTGGPHARRHRSRLPVHAEVSQFSEDNASCTGYYGCTPTRLLLDEGVIDASFTAVHATHVTDQDVTILGRARAAVAFCGTTACDLGAGIGPARALLDAGARLALGSGQQFAIDLFEEMRAIEMAERVVAGARGQLGLHALRLATVAHDCLGWSDAGELRAGAAADLVAIRLDSVRTAGVDPAQVLMSATASDVSDVAMDGRFVVEEGHHRLGEVGRLLDDAIEPFFRG